MVDSVTPNLRRWIRAIESIRDAGWKTAFVEAYDSMIDNAHAILTAEAKSAAISTEEYNLPIFIRPLETATKTRGCINIIMNDEDSVFVTVDLDATAGNIEDYASAVRMVRTKKSKGTLDKTRASWYWRNFIYGQAREGFTIKKKRVKGQRGRTPIKRKEGKLLYAETISERLSAMGTLAPYWSLIDKGNANVPSMTEGGTPYPANGPTNFTTRAELKIRTAFLVAYRRSQRIIHRELEQAEYGSNGLLEQIQNIVAEFESTSTWTPGQILQKLEIGKRMYEVHVTKTSRLGMRLSR